MGLFVHNSAAAATSAQTSTHCSHPAKLEGHFDSKVPNFTVRFRQGFEPYATTRFLVQKYHFTVSWIYAHSLSGFTIKNVEASLIPQLRCEPSIDSLSFDIPTGIT